MQIELGCSGVVGVYDSGVGGLTVCRRLRAEFPELGIVYLGDSARAPFGDKTINQMRWRVRNEC